MRKIGRDKLGRFIKGVHYSLKTEFRKGQKPNNFGRGTFQKGHLGYNKKPNSGSFKKGNIPPFKNRVLPFEIRKKISATLRKIDFTQWDSFINNENQRLRSSAKAENWRFKIFQRDDYTCLNCGKRGCYLNAHHIKPWSEYPKLRFDINNGITLCKICHS